MILVRNPRQETTPQTLFGRTLQVAKQRGISERLAVIDWVPYDERGAMLAEADVGLVSHRPGIETDLSVLPFNLERQLAVDQIEPDVGRTHPRALVAPRAATCEMDRTDDVPGAVSGVVDGGWNPLRTVLFGDARRAVTQGTGGAARVTAQTPTELPLPILPTFPVRQ